MAGAVKLHLGAFETRAETKRIPHLDRMFSRCAVPLSGGSTPRASRFPSCPAWGLGQRHLPLDPVVDRGPRDGQHVRARHEGHEGSRRFGNHPPVTTPEAPHRPPRHLFARSPSEGARTLSRSLGEAESGAFFTPLVSRSVGDCLRGTVICARTLPCNCRRGTRAGPGRRGVCCGRFAHLRWTCAALPRATWGSWDAGGDQGSVRAAGATALAQVPAGRGAHAGRFRSWLPATPSRAG